MHALLHLHLNTTYNVQCKPLYCRLQQTIRLDLQATEKGSRLLLVLRILKTQNVQECFFISYQGRVSFIQLQGGAKMTQHLKCNV